MRVSVGFFITILRDGIDQHISVPCFGTSFKSYGCLAFIKLTSFDFCICTDLLDTQKGSRSLLYKHVYCWSVTLNAVFHILPFHWSH